MVLSMSWTEGRNLVIEISLILLFYFLDFEMFPPLVVILLGNLQVISPN